MRTRLCLGLGVAAAAWSPALAEFGAQVGAGFTYDDNLFRQSRQLAALTGTTQRSDRIYSVNGEADAHFTPGDLDGRFQLNGGYNWYDRNGNLDNFNYSGRLALTRSTPDGIGFNINGLSQRQLSSFADVRQRLRNVQELNTIDAETTVPITPEIRLVVDPTYTQNTSSSNLLRFNDFRQYGIRAGIGWYTPLGNSIAITATRRLTKGLRDRQIFLQDGTTVDGRIDLADNSIDIKGTYAISPITSISGFVSYVDRNDKSVLNSDYHGPAGSVTFTYAPRETLTFDLTGGRRLEAQSFLYVDAVRTDFVTLTAYARLADRFDLTLVADHYRRRFRYDPTLAQTIGYATVNDRNYRLDAEVGYMLADAVRLAVRGTHEWRQSNVSFNRFSATAVQVSASYAFGRNGRATGSANRLSGMVL